MNEPSQANVTKDIINNLETNMSPNQMQIQIDQEVASRLAAIQLQLTEENNKVLQERMKQVDSLDQQLKKKDLELKEIQIRKE